MSGLVEAPYVHSLGEEEWRKAEEEDEEEEERGYMAALTLEDSSGEDESSPPPPAPAPSGARRLRRLSKTYFGDCRCEIPDCCSTKEKETYNMGKTDKLECEDMPEMVDSGSDGDG